MWRVAEDATERKSPQCIGTRFAPHPCSRRLVQCHNVWLVVSGICVELPEEHDCQLFSLMTDGRSVQTSSSDLSRGKVFSMHLSLLMFFVCFSKLREILRLFSCVSLVSGLCLHRGAEAAQIVSELIWRQNRVISESSICIRHSTARLSRIPHLTPTTSVLAPKPL